MTSLAPPTAETLNPTLNWPWTPMAKVLGYRIKTLANMGAYASTVGIIIQLMIGPWVSTSIYDIRTIDFTMDAVLTHTAPTSAYRGAGRPEAIYLIERLFNVAARKLGLDPAEIRRRNLIDPGLMPYTNAMGQTYDSGKFGSIMEQGLKLADWDGFAAREAESKANGKLRGRGMASFLEWTGGNVFQERVTVAVNGRRRPSRYIAATMPMGQGIATSYAQLVVDVLRRPHSRRIKIVMGDTDRGQGLRQRRLAQLFTAGSALNIAAEKTVANGKDLAAEALEAAAADIEYANGTFQIAGTDRASACSNLPLGNLTSASTSTRQARSPVQAGPMAVTSPRSKSTRKRRHRRRQLQIRQRHRPRGQSDDCSRTTRRRRGPGHRPGAGRTHAIR